MQYREFIIYKFIRIIYYKILDLQKSIKLSVVKHSFGKKDVEFKTNVKIDKESFFEGKNTIGANSFFRRTHIGYGTYCGENCLFEFTKIGKYCSIAKDVKIIAGNHPSSKFVSTHPAFFSKQSEAKFGYVHEQLYKEFKYINEKLFVEIGNDVWLGTGCSILEGVKIGDGAIVAANATVTKDVQPYTIVGGIPAKEIKKRFTEEEIKFLNEFQWWDKNEEWIKENALLFSDIERLMNEYE